MQTNIAIPEVDAPVTIVTHLMESRRADMLAVRLAGADQVERLICLSQWLRARATEIGSWPDGMEFSMLTAVVNIPMARVWPLDDYDSEDWPQDGVAVCTPPNPPDDAGDYWPTPLFRIREDGMLDVEGDGAEWGQIDLYSVRSQL